MGPINNFKQHTKESILTADEAKLNIPTHEAIINNGLVKTYQQQAEETNSDAFETKIHNHVRQTNVNDGEVKDVSANIIQIVLKWISKF